MAVPASRVGPQLTQQQHQAAFCARASNHQLRQASRGDRLLAAVPAALDRPRTSARVFVPRALVIEADGPLHFSTAAEGTSPYGEDFASDCEVHGAREQAPQGEATLAHRLRAAAGHAAVKAGQAAAQLRSFTLRLAKMVAKSIVLGVAAQLAHRQRLQQAAAEQRERAQAKLAAAAAARQASQAQLLQTQAARTQADNAFVTMLLRQDNPARTLEDKWADLSGAMRGDHAPELRKCTAQLFSAALDSSQAVQQAIAAEAAKGTKALDRLVSQHGCLEHEEALRSEIFSQILAGS